MANEAPKINYDMLAPVTAERDRAQKACEQMGRRISELEAALLRMTAIIETQTEPDIDALHDVARQALAGADNMSGWVLEIDDGDAAILARALKSYRPDSVEEESVIQFFKERFEAMADNEASNQEEPGNVWKGAETPFAENH
jgi:uncharacterized protein YbaP (TraB family)